jgi:ribonuclease Z
VLQRGEPVTLADGTVVTPEDVLGPARRGRTVVYSGDTAPSEVVRALSEGADVLVHEATFGDEEVMRAADTMHSTARQAAEIARDAGVRLLVLTHVSPRYFGPELLQEAREVFPAAIAPRDFDVVEVPFPERGEPTLVKGGALPERAGGLGLPQQDRVDEGGRMGSGRGEQGDSGTGAGRGTSA